MFDPIMQVGKEPQYTMDSSVNPLGFYDDVTQLAFGQRTLIAGVTESGSIVNVTNPSFNYGEVGVTTLGYRRTDVAVADAVVMLWDVGRSLNLRGITVVYDFSGAAVNELVIELSSDGVGYVEVSRLGPGNGTFLEFTTTFADRQVRFLRMTWHTGGAGEKILNMRMMRLQINNVQRFY